MADMQSDKLKEIYRFIKLKLDENDNEINES